MTADPPSRRQQWETIATPSLANLLLACLAALLFAAVAFASVMRQDPIYRSSAVMLMDQPLQIARGNEGAVVKLNILRGKYTAILTTDAVMVPAAAKAGVSVGVVRGAQRPTFASEALTIFPVAESDDPDLAQRLAQASAEALSEYVTAEQAATGLEPPDRISLRIIQDARPGVQASPDRAKARQVAIVAGGGGLLLAYVVLQLVSAKRRHG
jgi:hypothetical protein